MDLNSRYRWYKIVLQDELRAPCVYYFRGVTNRELRIAGTKPTTFDAENYLLEQVVLPQKDWNNMLAGVATKLLQEILKYSGLTEEQLTFTEALDWMQSENGAMEAAAVAMIPSCTPDVLENCDPYHYAKYLIMGKFQFESMYGIPVEQAFLPESKRPSKEGVGIAYKPDPAHVPGPGEKIRQTESAFEWRRQ